MPEHCRFIGCEKGSALFADVLSSLGNVHTKQVLSADFDRTRSARGVEASKAFVREMAALALKKVLIAGLCR